MLGASLSGRGLLLCGICAMLAIMAALGVLNAVGA